MTTLLAFLFGIAASLTSVLSFYLYGASIISELALLLMLVRYGSAYIGAFLLGYRANDVKPNYVLVLMAPPLIIEHAIFIYESGTISNLWPPILLIDILFFLLCFPIMSLGKWVHLKQRSYNQ